METIRSRRNPRIVAAARLHDPKERRQRGLTLLEGPHLVVEAVAAGAPVVQVFGLEDDDLARDQAGSIGAEWIPVGPEALERIASTDTPRGPVAVIEIPAEQVPRRDLVWLELADPGNAGTLIRTAAAFGIDVRVAEGAVDPWAPKVLRSSAGGHFRTHVSKGPMPSGWRRICTVVTGGVDPARLSDVLDPDRLWAVLVGSEAHGLRADEGCDVEVTIPMPGGSESLNAAVAGAIVLYELEKWRRSVR